MATGDDADPGRDVPWLYSHDTTMSTFWAVRRLRPSDIVEEYSIQIKSAGKTSGNTHTSVFEPEANCVLQDMHIHKFLYATIPTSSESHSPTYIESLYEITFEAITNSKPIIKGSELIIEIPEDTEERLPSVKERLRKDHMNLTQQGKKRLREANARNERLRRERKRASDQHQER